MCYLKISNLCKKFNNNLVLNNINMEIEKGEIVTIIGNSGNGKTTLLRCLNDLEKIDGGSIYLNGSKIYPKKKGESYNFGYIFQSFNLFPQYTVLENIVLAKNLLYKDIKRNNKISKKDYYEENKLKALTLLERLGILDKANSYPYELSGGQKQRVAIARALILEPSIIFFDEPTSALDPTLIGNIENLIKELKEDGNTIVVVSHDMNFARNISDKVYFMSNGMVVEEGKGIEIFDNPKSIELRSFLGIEGQM